jgi:signal transduction histidine kinase
VALDRPHDEIRELGDTFDDMLARLEGAFTAQRRFSSQVSHELRTPLAIISAEVDLLRSDAEPRHAKSLEEIRRATERAERIIAALLALARSGSGDLTPERLELGVLVGDVLGEMVNGAEWRGLRVELDLAEAPVGADKALVERLVTNMLANAARHNRPEGWVEVRTCVHDAWAVIEVENSTSPSFMPTEDTARRRGIGLTVVDAVLAAHGGHLTVEEPASDRRLTRASLLCAGVHAEPATVGLGADR